MARVSQRLPREERRAQVLAAAAAAFMRTGFDGTSMEDVARSAGVTRLIVYRIFETKHALYRSVLDAVLEGLEARFEGGAPDNIAAAVLAVARSQPDGFRLLWRHAAHEPDFADVAEGFRKFATDYADTMIHRVLHDRTMRRWAARAVVAHLYDGVCGWLDDGDPSRDAEFAVLLAAGIRNLVAAWSAPVH
jgi:AcrR family transcriptional regulator